MAFFDCLGLWVLAVPIIILVIVLAKGWLGRLSSKEEQPKDTVILHQIGRGPFAPSVSPFPLKLETYLRMARIPYKNVHGVKFSSKGKTPWMEYNGEAVADSQFCIDFLNKKLGIDLSKHLSFEERAVARAFQKMTEENLYWSMCGTTFGSDLDGLKAVVPYRGVKLWVFARVLRYVIQKEMWGHGIGRHSKREVEEIGRNDLQALSVFLGNKPFFMGQEPCEVDCAIFGMMAQCLWHMPGSPHEKLVKDELSNLRDYCLRMKEAFWPDWDQCITSNNNEAKD